jgi:GAF domain-containing protein
VADFPLTEHVLNEGVIATVDAEDPDADQAEVAELRRDGMRGLIMLPLVAKGEVIGIAEIASSGRPTEDAGRITLARTMAHEGAMALENARAYEAARNLADRDPLTGFYNHRYLQQRLAGYEYGRDFGGVFYLYVRGMAPRYEPGCGVFFDRPVEALIRALSEFLESASVPRDGSA